MTESLINVLIPVSWLISHEAEHRELPQRNNVFISNKPLSGDEPKTQCYTQKKVCTTSLIIVRNSNFTHGFSSMDELVFWFHNPPIHHRRGTAGTLCKLTATKITVLPLNTFAGMTIVNLKKVHLHNCVCVCKNILLSSFSPPLFS